MHTQKTLHLTDEQVEQIEATLSNDENSSDKEIVDFFVNECGIFQYQAEKVMEHRISYLSNIFLGNDTPIRNGSKSAFQPL